MQNVKSIKDKTFPVGYNDKVSPQNVPDGYCITAQNLFLTERNIAQRSGYSVSGTNTNTLLVSKAVLGASRFETGSTKQILKAYDNAGGTDTDIYYWTGSGDWTKITDKNFATNGLNVEFSNANANIYATNGADAVIKWTGSTGTTPAGFPITKYLLWYHNYMFALNNSSYKSRLYFSNLGDPETWGANDYIDLNPNDGYEITGAAPFKDDMIIGKGNRVYAFTGWGDTSFTVKSIQDQSSYGCVAGRTMVDCGTYFMYLSMVGNIPHIVALQRTTYDTIVPAGIVSNDIEGTMKGLNKDYLYNATGYFDGRRAWFHVPNGSSTTNNLTIVVDITISGFNQQGIWQGGWTKHTGIRSNTMFASNISGANAVYFGEADATKTSKLYTLDTSNTDDGVAIEMVYESRNLTPSNVNPTKWKYLWMYGDAVGNINVHVDTRGDFGALDDQGTISLAPTGTVFPFVFPATLGATGIIRKRFDLNYSRVRSMQLKLSISNSSTPAVINDYEFMGYLRPVGQT